VSMVVGTPYLIEDNSVIGSEWQQYFRTGNPIFNLIHYWKLDGACSVSCGQTTRTQFVVNQVAEEFKLNRSTYGLPTEDTQSTDSDSYCKQTFTLKTIDLCNNFSDDIIVRDNKSYTINYKVFLAGPNLLNEYRGNNSKVWILLHGWNDSSTGPVCDLRSKIQSQDSTATVICVDWSSIADQHRTLSAIVNDQGPQLEAGFIAEVSAKLTENLTKWKGNNILKDNLYIVGHSLGSLLGGQISSDMGGAKFLLALDPPGRNINNSYYQVGGKDFNTFQTDAQRNFTKAQFVRALVSQGEFADNPILASTADESILVDYTTLSGGGGKHSGWNTSGLLNYLTLPGLPFTRTTTLFGFTDGTNSLPKGNHKSDYPQTYSAFTKIDTIKPQFLRVAEDGGVPGNNYTLYGTSGDDDINDNQLVNKKYTIKQGGGNDKITSYDDYGNRMQYNFISWQSGSRIKFANGGASIGACTVERIVNNLTIVTNELWCTFNGQQLLTARFDGVTPNDMKLKWEAFKAGTSQTNNAGDPSITIFQ
jgi:hypothetical protein